MPHRPSVARLLVLTGSLFAAWWCPSGAANACTGGIVTAEQGSVGGDAQRILISVHDGKTDVVTQIGVPRTDADYGVLIPVPAQPTLDQQPVISGELDALDAQTAPRILIASGAGGGDSGCACAPVANKQSVGTPGTLDGGVRVSQPVTIGPVTAVVLTSDSSSALAGWLAANGFAIAAADQPLVDAYAGTGRYFIAVRRGAAAVPAADGAPSSVGLHFTLPGDQRAVPLRFARLGGASRVAFTVLVVSDTAVRPGTPFESLTLDDLDGTLLKTVGYQAAVVAAVGQRADHAFIQEGTWSAELLASGAGGSVRPFLPPGKTVTRLSTIVPATALDSDVAFDQASPANPPRERFVGIRAVPEARRRGRTWMAATTALVAMAAVIRRRRQPR